MKRAIAGILLVLLLAACTNGPITNSAPEIKQLLSGTYAAVGDDFYMKFNPDGTLVMLNEPNGYPQKIVQYHIENDKLIVTTDGRTEELGTLEVLGDGSGFVLHAKGENAQYVKVS